MSPAVLGWLDAQTLVDAFGLGAVYALMAVGIGLVFGVLRLVNFAYGQLIMAGAYTLAFTSQAGWPTSGARGVCSLSPSPCSRSGRCSPAGPRRSTS